MPGILTDLERESLRTEIAEVVSGNPAGINAIIPTYHFTRIATDSVPIRFAYNILRYCEQLAWIENPSLLIRLLQYWEYKPLFNDAIKRINQQQPPRFFPGNRPWDTVLLALDLPFLNRKLTRMVVEHFFYPLIGTVEPPGIRVLVVKGPSKSGKTYTADYIKYINICYSGLAFKVVWIDLKRHFSGAFGPRELTEAILDQVNPDWKLHQVTLPEQDNQQEARSIQQLSSIIAEQMAYMNKIHILVIDGFGEQEHGQSAAEKPPVPKAIVEMIQQLAMIATGSQMTQLSGDMMRLVLLGFDQPVSNYLNRTRVDLIQPLNQSDIVEYFKNYITVHKPKQPITQGAIIEMANSVLSADNPSDPERTKKLSAVALEVAKQILNS